VYRGALSIATIEKYLCLELSKAVEFNVIEWSRPSPPPDIDATKTEEAGPWIKRGLTKEGTPQMRKGISALRSYIETIRNGLMVDRSRILSASFLQGCFSYRLIASHVAKRHSFAAASTLAEIANAWKRCGLTIIKNGTISEVIAHMEAALSLELSLAGAP
jgi:hypothetical protein